MRREDNSPAPRPVKRVAVERHHSAVAGGTRDPTTPGRAGGFWRRDHLEDFADLATSLRGILRLSPKVATRLYNASVGFAFEDPVNLLGVMSSNSPGYFFD